MKQAGTCEYAIDYYTGYDYRCPETHRVWRHWPSIGKMRWLSQTVVGKINALPYCTKSVFSVLLSVNDKPIELYNFLTT